MISVVVIAPEELAKLIDSAVKKALDGAAGIRSEREFRPSKEAPIPRTTLDKLRDEKVVRSCKVGREVYYHVGDLSSWLENQSKKPKPEPAEVIEAADAFEAARARARARRAG